MAACPRCGAEYGAGGVCATCGPPAPTHGHKLASAIFAHIPHPHITHRKLNPPQTTVDKRPPGAITRFNAFLAVRVTDAVGTMWCAYLFAALALVSLPSAIQQGTAALVAWTAQTFIQLVLLSIIIVGQKVAGESSDKRAIDTYNDAEAVLHEAIQIQQHLVAQDALLQRLIGELCERGASPVVAAAADNAATPASNC